MNKKVEIKKWVKEHKAEITVFAYGALATGIGFAFGYKCHAKQGSKALQALGQKMYVTNCSDYKIADLGKVGLDSLTVPSCPDYANENLKVNAVMFFYDKP